MPKLRFRDVTAAAPKFLGDDYLTGDLGDGYTVGPNDGSGNYLLSFNGEPFAYLQASYMHAAIIAIVPDGTATATLLAENGAEDPAYELEPHGLEDEDEDGIPVGLGDFGKFPNGAAIWVARGYGPSFVRIRPDHDYWNHILYRCTEKEVLASLNNLL